MTIARSPGSKKGNLKQFSPVNDAANDAYQICSLAVQFEKNGLPIPVLSVYDGKETRVGRPRVLKAKSVKVRLLLCVNWSDLWRHCRKLGILSSISLPGRHAHSQRSSARLTDHSLWAKGFARFPWSMSSSISQTSHMRIFAASICCSQRADSSAFSTVCSSLPRVRYGSYAP